MTAAIAVFLGLTLTSAATLALFVANVRFIAGRSRPFPKWALVPFVTPVLSWRRGARALPIALASVVMVYASLQTLVLLGALS